MLGAMETSKSPEVAPSGIVIVMDVPLQVLIVTAAPFSRTALPPCEAPKPEPEITTWLPIEPVVAETAVMTGAGVAAELTDTPSNVAVAKEDVVRLLTPGHADRTDIPVGPNRRKCRNRPDGEGNRGGLRQAA